MYLKWLYLDLNSYFASVEQQTRPETRNNPVIVVPMVSDFTCAIAASYEAKALGIKTNTSVADAKKICKNASKKLFIVPADHKKYVDFHNKIIQAIEEIIPVETVASIDEFVCELQGIETTPEGAVNIAKKIKDNIYKNLGEYIKCSIGICSNKLLAKIASDMQKPNGLVIINPKDTKQTLFKIGLSDIPGIGKNMLKRLHQNKIYEIKQLIELEPKHLRKIWHSVSGERLWYLLHGYDLPDLETSRKTIGHSHVLDPKFRTQTKALIVAQRLMLKTSGRLRRYGFYAKSMSLSIRSSSGKRIFLKHSFYRACDNFSFMKNLFELWQKATSQLAKNEKVKKISIVLFDLVDSESIQPEIFDFSSENNSKKIKKQENLSKAMDLINAKFGRDSIVMGFSPNEAKGFSGTKVAFTRIPEYEEFYE
jgi:DNA polymerase-4